MEVIVLAGGLGTRLRSVVNEVPKCMAPVADKPFLWYLLTYLGKYPVEKVIFAVGYLRESIMSWAETVKDEFPFAIDFSIEEEPLGTGGGIRQAMEKVESDEAVILNGDTFYDVDLDVLTRDFRAVQGCKLMLALKPMTDFDRYGEVQTAGDGRILNFAEKKPCKAGNINGGVYVLARESGLLDDQGTRFSFETDVLQRFCGPQGCIYGEVHRGYFIDIGIPEDYDRAQRELPKHVF